MIQETLQHMITSAVAALHEQATLVLPPEGIPAVEIEHPQRSEHGDFDIFELDEVVNRVENPLHDVRSPFAPAVGISSSFNVSA